MKKTALFALIVLAGTAALAAAPADKPLLSYKLTGLWPGIGGGEYNDCIVGENGYLKAASTSMSGAYEELGRGLGFQIEVILPLGGSLGVGVGGGYYRIRSEGTVQYAGIAEDVAFNVESTLVSRLSVLPFFLNLHFTRALGPRLTLDAFAGPLFQIVQFNADNPSTSTLLQTEQTVTFTATKTSLGAQAGLGVSYRLLKSISLVLDALYRTGQVTDLKGNWARVGSDSSGTIAGSSDAYYLWAYDMAAGGTHQRAWFFGENGPDVAGAANARKAAIGLSGLSAQAGVRISF
jgi:hypothetical protein